MSGDSVGSQIVFSHRSTEIIFDGFEIGVKVKTGLSLIRKDKIKNA